MTVGMSFLLIRMWRSFSSIDGPRRQPLGATIRVTM